MCAAGNVACAFVSKLSMPREIDGATASTNKEVQKAQEQAQEGKGEATTSMTMKHTRKIAKYLCDHGCCKSKLGHVVTIFTL